MTYYAVYNPLLDNALVGVAESFSQVPEGLTLASFDGEVPDLTQWYWHPGSLAFLRYPQKDTLTKLEFLRRFTQAERIAIREFAKTDVLIDDFMQLLDIAEFIDTSDQDTNNALQYLAYKSIINPSRINEVLG